MVLGGLAVFSGLSLISFLLGFFRGLFRLDLVIIFFTFDFIFVFLNIVSVGCGRQAEVIGDNIIFVSWLTDSKHVFVLDRCRLHRLGGFEELLKQGIDLAVKDLKGQERIPIEQREEISKSISQNERMADPIIDINLRV